MPGGKKRRADIAREDHGLGWAAREALEGALYAETQMMEGADWRKARGLSLLLEGIACTKANEWKPRGVPEEL